MPALSYVTDHDDSGAYAQCYPLSDVYKLAKLAYWGSKLLKILRSEPPPPP